MSVSLAFIGYAAGFYEGEGSFIENYVSITQKDIEPLEKLQKVFGGNINNYSGYYYWRLYGLEMRQFILTIFSLLSDRRKQQILKCKDVFTAQDTCPNGHVYQEGSFEITFEESRNRSFRTCLTCKAANIKKKNEREADPKMKLIRTYMSVNNVDRETAEKALAHLLI